MNKKIKNSYRIGAITTLTGISADSLRVWEKRYGRPKPQRTSSGNRLYNEEDLTWLNLVKKLLDAGDSIGNLAYLDLETLKTKVALVCASRTEVNAKVKRRCRAIIVGNVSVVDFKKQEHALGLERLDSLETYLDTPHTQQKPDLVIFNFSTLSSADPIHIENCRKRLKANFAIVIYRFSQSHIVTQLNTSCCMTLQAPVDVMMIRQLCQSIVNHVTNGRHAIKLPDPLSPIPEKQFSEDDIAQLANISTSIECECPHHLAEVISTLNAFEDYSAHCESQSPKDTAIHAYLYHTTAHARALVEKALKYLMQAENITLKNHQ